jgi:hypothetical protein
VPLHPPQIWQRTLKVPPKRWYLSEATKLHITSQNIGNAPILHSGGTRFESYSGYPVSWLRCFLVSLLCAYQFLYHPSICVLKAPQHKQQEKTFPRDRNFHIATVILLRFLLIGGYIEFPIYWCILSRFLVRGNGYWQLPASLIDEDRIPSTRLPLVRITRCYVLVVPDLYERNPIYCLLHPLTGGHKCRDLVHQVGGVGVDARLTTLLCCEIQRTKNSIKSGRISEGVVLAQKGLFCQWWWSWSWYLSKTVIPV